MEIIKFFKEESIDPSDINSSLEQLGTVPLTQKVKMFSVLSRPHVAISHFNFSEKAKSFLSNYNNELTEQAEILMKYEGYIEKEKEMADKMIRLENIELHSDFIYNKIASLSAEAKEKFSKIKPRTIGQASRISGISPADISVLMVYLGR
jgi:tRNA uridine 5-carboxymethylaminomethyl modification enzyme